MTRIFVPLLKRTVPEAGLHTDGLRNTAYGVSRSASSGGSPPNELEKLVSGGRSLSGGRLLTFLEYAWGQSS